MIITLESKFLIKVRKLLVHTMYCLYLKQLYAELMVKRRIPSARNLTISCQYNTCVCAQCLDYFWTVEVHGQ